MRFDQHINPGGYAWWYIDAISDDGAQALTIIAFIGSVFSPYYAWANRKSPASAENHCAINVALYQRRGGYWAMTERSAQRLRRTANTLGIGNSALHWDGAGLTAEINEHCAPVPYRLRGKVTLTPGPLQPEIYPLDAAANHRWQPIAPRARITVAFDRPQISWSGSAYLDHNNGEVPLGQDFSTWHWARFDNKILYDVEYRNGGRRNLSLTIAADGTATAFNPPPPQALPATFWRVGRVTRSDPGHQAKIIKTLEDAPFYARSLVTTQLNGEAVTGVHESLSLQRFAAPWVRALLPFRMPRFG